MRVLIISRNAWDDTNSIGNTLSNFFTGIDNLEFASVYFRSASPNNKLCREYYRVTETEVLKNWFASRKIGKRFTYNSSFAPAAQTKGQMQEKKVVNFIRSHNFKFAYWLSDRIWYSKKWQNPNLRDFIRSFAPDIAVTFVKSAPQYYLMVRYIREKFNIPILSWIADDEYTGLLKKKDNKRIESLRYIVAASSIVTGCSQEICDYYNTVFGCSATPLYKSCDMSSTIKEDIDKPTKIIYAGNLLYGRMDIIRNVARVLENYDPKGEKVSFEIYSNTPMSSDDEKYLNDKRSTKYMGCLAYDLMKRRIETADVVLHVESFEEEQILKTRYSFSTKIIDCLQSGTAMLGIGPGKLASIAYMKKIPGACVIENQTALEDSLVRYLADKESFSERRKQIRDFACKYHDSAANAQKIEATLKKAIEEGA